ncbi:hypothetical protein J2X65_004267 [Ancylobacter sp. 3268]|uniref:hypothetical protein n=1 Tax=Ancylobacter sp. 3268 TaxID=2817752 RepID=UPI0028550875|nr:hypothetical protein [Ancylobacter sp. 3268]MDR6954891.1 hypothetical protein [Ancylobacter sp. 3268]
MTKLDWTRGRHSGGWSIERSPYRPYTPSEVLRGRTQHAPQKPTVLPATGPMTLARLVTHGINRVSVWCPACRRAEHRDIATLAAETLTVPLTELGVAVRCDRCGGSTIVSAFRSEARILA